MGLEQKLKQWIATGALGLGLSLLPGNTLAQDWPEPTNLGTAVNTAADENNPERTADGTKLYFDRDGKIFFADYNSTTEKFENAQLFPEIHRQDYVESDITFSPDTLDMVYWTYDRLTQSPHDSILRLAHRPRSDALATEYVFRDLTESDNISGQQFFNQSPSFFRNSTGLAFVETCEGISCGNADFPNAYETYRTDTDTNSLFTLDYAGNPAPPRRMVEFEPLIDPDSDPTTPNGGIASIGTSPDGLAAIVGLYGPGLNCPGGIGDVDLFYVTRASLADLFNVPNGKFLNTSDQPVDINSSIADSGASLWGDSIYFHTKALWPGAQTQPDGTPSYDLYVTTPGCSTAVPGEVSGSGSPYPLLVAKSGSDLKFSFEALRDGCGIRYNLYGGQLLPPPWPFYNVSGDFVCHDPAVPDGIGRLSFSAPSTTGITQYFLVTASTLAGESTPGHVSDGAERPRSLYNLCGPLP